MPVYTLDLKVPADTAETAPVKAEVEIEEGVIVKVEVIYPPGPQGMVHTQCLYGIRQLWPRPEGETFHLEDMKVEIPEHWTPPELPCILTVRGWSPGTRFSHTITWMFYTLPRPLAAPWVILQDFVLILKRLMGIA